MLKYILFLIRLRLLQIGRALQNLGMGFGLVLLFIVTLLTLGFLQNLSKNQSIVWCCAVAAPSWSIFFARKDLSFLRQSSFSLQKILAVEHLLLSVPLAIIVAFFQNIQTVLLGVLLSVLIVFLPLKMNEKKHHALSFDFLPLKNFEWRMGFRKVNYSIFFPMLFYFLTPFFEGGILLFTLFSTLFMISFYHYSEPKEWIDKSFNLEKKLFRHLLLWTIFWLPTAILHVCFFPALWYFLPISWLFGSILISFCISYKYAKWLPNQFFSGIDKVGNIYFALMLIIFTFPIPFLAAIFYWTKAKKNRFLEN